MEYIHELVSWPELTWDKGRLSDLLADVRHRQGLLVGKMLGLGFSLRTEAKLETLTADVVKSSAIEGEKLNSEEVRSSIARRLGIENAGRIVVGRDVEGIVEMMLDATQSFREALTTERLFAWHAALFPTGRSAMRKIAVGVWRGADAGAMQVVSGAVGQEKIHFEAPPADRLGTEMSAFLNWFETEKKTDAVVKAGVAHFWFVTIHPFEDGNGRIGRAIADMALARADGTAERFYSMSSQIEAERKEYYLQLERAQRSSLDITDWLEWFLGCLARAISRAEETLHGVMQKAKFWEHANRFDLNDRQRTVLNRVLDGFDGKLTSPKYAKLAKCSDDTALRDMKALIDLGILRKGEGKGRKTEYVIVER